jgi:The GLUG motif
MSKHTLIARTFAAATFAIALTSSANAALIISRAQTSGITCAAGVCTATAASAVLNIKQLKQLLNAGSLKIASGSVAQDIEIDDQFTWTSPSRLALDAFRSITFDAPVTVEGKGDVTIKTDDGGTGGDYSFVGKGKLAFWDTSSILTINAVVYMLAADLPSLLDAMGAHPDGAFALVKGYDASIDGIYQYSPFNGAFSGTLEGLGHAITNLTVELPTTDYNIGLFKELDAPASVRDLNLVNVDFEDYNFYQVGAVVGYNNGGALKNIFVSGKIEAADGAGVVGGVDAGTLENIHSSVTVITSSAGGGIDIGGANISGCLFDGTVSAGGVAGGVSASFYGTMSGCRSTGTVSGKGYVGGLVGYSKKLTITASSSSSPVTGGYMFSKNARKKVYSAVGGLVGYSKGDVITDSYATGSVTDTDGYMNTPYVGGLVGQQVDGKIVQCFSTGAVSGESAGGLVGSNTGLIQQSYALGAVQGSQYVGGLVGEESGKILQSYSIGSVSTAPYSGGVIGFDLPTSSGNSSDYWDLDTSGISNTAQGAGFPANDPGIAGLSDAQLKSGLPDGLSDDVWAQSTGINNGYPYLIANPPPQ